MKFRSVAHYNGGDTVTALQKRTAHCAFCLMPTPTAALEACVMIFKWMEVRMCMCMCVCVCMCMHKETPSHPLGRRTFMRRACLFGS